MGPGGGETAGRLAGGRYRGGPVDVPNGQLDGGPVCLGCVGLTDDSEAGSGCIYRRSWKDNYSVFK